MLGESTLELSQICASDTIPETSEEGSEAVVEEMIVVVVEGTIEMAVVEVEVEIRMLSPFLHHQLSR